MGNVFKSQTNNDAKNTNPLQINIEFVEDTDKNMSFSPSKPKVKLFKSKINTPKKVTKFNLNTDVNADSDSDEKKFVPTQRHIFSPKERQTIAETFQHVLKSNLPKGEYEKALRTNKTFKDLVLKHQSDGKTLKKIKVQVINSFRAMRR